MRDLSRVLRMYASAAKVAAQRLLANSLIILLSAALFLVVQFASGIFGQFGMAGGFVIGMLQIVGLTYFYSWISALLQRDKVTLTNCKEFDYPLFSSLISVAFILFIAKMLIQTGTAGMNSRSIMLFVDLGIVFAFNAIPEVIVVSRQESIPALMYALEFVRDNLIAWFIPVLLVVTPLLLVNPEFALVVFVQTDPLLPVLFIFQVLKLSLGITPMYFLALPLAIVGALWFTLFRMELFRSLDRSSS